MTEKTVACPSCGRQVDNLKAHEGYRCAEWPKYEDNVRGVYRYRDYDVAPSEGFYGWEWAHKDYNGPEDNRAGHEDGMLQCFMAIDEKEDF